MLRVLRFNPSQVGYKHRLSRVDWSCAVCFNPSQVGYKLAQTALKQAHAARFNPSQVGYKLGIPNCIYSA